MSAATPLRRPIQPSSAAVAALLAAMLSCPARTQSLAPTPAGPAVSRTQSAFVENRGQWDGDFLYAARAGAMSLFVERTGWMLTIETRREKPRNPHDALAIGPRGTSGCGNGRGVAIGMHFGGGRAAAVVPGKRSPGVHNYFLGSDPSRWRTDLPLVESVDLAGAWAGTDVRCRIEGGRFEYDLLLMPGADPDAISFEVSGADGMRLGEDGALVLETAMGPVRSPQPKCWQIGEHDVREPVECSYVLLDGRRFGFRVSGRDLARPLVIDPPLVYSTFLGGSAWDYAYAVAVDPAGAATTAGFTPSVNFPTTAGAYATSPGGGYYDAFVTRLSPTGNALVYSTYLGGNDDDGVNSVALDGTGAVILAGSTASTNFPTTAGAFQTTFGGGSHDAFVVRLNASGNGLLSSTYLGGTDDDFANRVALDASGATVVGATRSGNFPVTAGAYDTTFNGGFYDAFVTRLNPSGTALVYSTFLGGNDDDEAGGVALEMNGAATVVGLTASSNFPVTLGAYDTVFNGNFYDAFVVRLNPSGTALVYSTFLGGGSDDQASAVAVDATGAATVVGATGGAGFPVTPGAYTNSPGGAAAFVTRVGPGGNSLTYSCVVGGNVFPSGATDVVLDATGAATIVGYSGDQAFPTTNGAWDQTWNGASDAFLARISPGGNALAYSTFLGGASNDFAFGVALEPASGTVVVVGETQSPGFPATAGAYDTSANGSYDAFVARLQPVATSVVLNVQPDVFGSTSGSPIVLTASAPGVTGTPTFAWKRDGVPVAGGSGGVLTIPSSTASDAGTYEASLVNTPGFTGVGYTLVFVASPLGGLLTVSQPAGSGSLSIAINTGSPSAGGLLYFDYISIAQGGPANWFGVPATLSDLLNQSSFGPPFFGTLDASGAAGFWIPGGALPAPLLGLTFAFQAILLTPSLSILGSMTTVQRTLQ